MKMMDEPWIIGMNGKGMFVIENMSDKPQDPWIGSSGQLGVLATYYELEAVLGKPDCRVSEDKKVTSEWRLQVRLSDNEIKIFDEIHGKGNYKNKINYYTIYDYKNTEEYDSTLPSIEETKKEMYYWHIGGFDKNYPFDIFYNWLCVKLYNLRLKEKESEGTE